MNTWSLPTLLSSLHDDIERRLAAVRKSFGHPTTKGDAGEHVWLELLSTYLPKRYQAEKAHVVDSNGVPIPRSFDFWDSKNDKLGDGRASYGFGFEVSLGPFQLVWSFAHQMDDTIEVCDIAGDGICNLSTDVTRIPDPFHEGGTIGQFYIASDF